LTYTQICIQYIQIQCIWFVVVVVVVVVVVDDDNDGDDDDGGDDDDDDDDGGGDDDDNDDDDDGGDDDVNDGGGDDGDNDDGHNDKDNDDGDGDDVMMAMAISIITIYYNSSASNTINNHSFYTKMFKKNNSTGSAITITIKHMPKNMNTPVILG